jgi:adenylate kinase family enzyme
MDNIETQFWHSARHILHFAGICGAGKTTLSNRIASRCHAHGGVASSTLDWDLRVPDQRRLTERAFRRDLDLALIADPTNTAIHRQIVDHSLAVIADWKESKSNLVVVDRFVESYDHLPPDAVREIQGALAESGFRVSQVLLVIGLELNRHDGIAARLQHTKDHRPAQWWDTTPKDLDVFAEDEAQYQEAYRSYCEASPYDTAVVDTTKMDWNQYEQALVDHMMLDSELANHHWTDSMKQHAINAHNYFSPSSKHGMSRPGFKWFATMPGVIRRGLN